MCVSSSSVTVSIQCRTIFDEFVCVNHKRTLLTCWTSNSFANKKNRQLKITCSLPEVCCYFSLFSFSFRSLIVCWFRLFIPRRPWDQCSAEGWTNLRRWSSLSQPVDFSMSEQVCNENWILSVWNVFPAVCTLHEGLISSGKFELLSFSDSKSSEKEVCHFFVTFIHFTLFRHLPKTTMQSLFVGWTIRCGTHPRIAMN